MSIGDQLFDQAVAIARGLGAFDRGSQAYRSGQSRDDNPYAMETKDWGVWDHGWLDAFHARMIQLGRG